VRLRERRHAREDGPAFGERLRDRELALLGTEEREALRDHDRARPVARGATHGALHRVEVSLDLVVRGELHDTHTHDVLLHV